MNERANIAPLAVGGIIGAIVPQTIEETWRLATTVVEAGIAPVAVTGKEPKQNAPDDEFKRWAKKATSAVVVILLSGAELGLPPMVALRSFTVIGGRPALYGDGIINVVRRSGKTAYLRTGFAKDDIEIMRRAGVLPSAKEEERNPGITQQALAKLSPDERAFGWCSAKRADTGEEKTLLFSIAEARRANLWDERQTVRRPKWNSNDWEDKPNDSIWFRYPQRMLAWRAAGYCLRELFADVLGGVRDEFEAREIAGEVIEHHEAEVKPVRIAPPSPPKPPSPGKVSSGIDPIPDNGFDKDLLGDPIEPDDQQDYGKFFEEFQNSLEGCRSEADVEEIWNELDVEARFQDDDDSRQLADRIKWQRLSVINPTGAI